MNLPKLIAYAWIVSVLISIVVTVDRNQPIAQAFRPIKDFRFFCCQMLMFGVVGLLAAWQFYSDSLLYGQKPMTWAILILLVYAWICLVAYVRRGR